MEPMLKTRTTTFPRATWREHFLAVARRAGEPLNPEPAAFGLRPRGHPGLSAFARRRTAGALATA